jgi:enoyl-CoA hydratase
MTKPECILYTAPRPGLAEIRFNRPHRLNAVVEPLFRETLDALAAAEDDRSVRVVILTGEGRAFCVGADLKEHAAGTRTPWQRREYLQLAQDVCARIHRLRKPVVAAVNGYALGAGAEMAVNADFVLIAESAQIGFPETSIGTFIGGGLTGILAQLVGLAKARELVFLGQRVDGREAKAIGLANAAFADDVFRDEVYVFAERLAAQAPLSIALAKEQINNGSQRTYDTALITELEGVLACMMTRDWQEGIDAFAQKRKPAFRGE